MTRAESPYAVVGHRIADLRRSLGRRAGRRVLQRDVAEAVGVHPVTVNAWEGGRYLPEGDNLDRLAELLGVSPAYVLHGAGPDPSGDAPGSPESEFMEFFDQVVRFLGGIAPPGQARARKLDALEGLRRMLSARGTVPDAWYTLRERVERDEF